MGIIWLSPRRLSNLIFGCATIVAAVAPTVQLQYATVVGSTANSVDTFQGIPFAEPPTGTLRLQESQAITSSQGTVTATSSPTACPQFTFSTSGFPFNLLGLLLDTPLFQAIQNQGEDCLTLNVQRPANVSSTAKLPGGAFVTGATSSYDGTSIIETSMAMDEPVIFVTANYRLGGFGFLPGQEVLDAGIANLGLVDQRLALKRVADNIAQFGGDPRRVTIWGESAGSDSVFQHLVLYGGNNTYNGEPLFSGAVMDSGSFNPSQSVNGGKGQAVYDQVVSAGGCSSANDTLSCLRDLPYSTFLNAANSVTSLLSYTGPSLTYRPRPDGVVVPTSPQLSLQKGKYVHIPTIIGDQDDEGTLDAIFTSNVTTVPDLVGYFDLVYPNCSHKIHKKYISQYSTNPAAGSPFGTGDNNVLYPQYKMNAAVLGDVNIRLIRRYFLNTVGSSVPTWSYVSTYEKSTPFLGTYHSTDVPYAFGESTGFPMQTIQAYYISFVNHHNPNTGSGGLPTWPRWISDKQLMNISSSTISLTPDNFRSSAYAVLTENLSQFIV